MSTKDKLGWFLIVYGVFNALSGGGIPSFVPGPRTVAIYHETAEDTPAQARLFTSLRDGVHADYLDEKGTLLDVLDITSNPQPDATLKLPSLYINAGGSAVYKGPLPATADGTMEVIKFYGG